LSAPETSCGPGWGVRFRAGGGEAGGGSCRAPFMMLLVAIIVGLVGVLNQEYLKEQWH
jgi:hypothetical protein